jgi:hypothetical protein
MYVHSRLDSNRLTGPVPASIGNLVALKNLQVFFSILTLKIILILIVVK